MAQILEDTRQQAGKHENKARWFADHGVEVERRKLDFGDYMDASGSSNIAVDTKRSIDEVAMDCGRDHERFVREMERARAAGFRLVVLVEVGNPYRAVADIDGWVSGACKRCDLYRIRGCDPRESGGCAQYRSKPMQGTRLVKIMRTLEERHGCRFETCPPSRAAQRICALLGVAYER